MTEAAPHGIPNPAAANLAGQPLTPEALRGNLTSLVDRVMAHYGQPDLHYNYQTGVSPSPPHSTVEAFDYRDGSRREVTTRPDGTKSTLVRLSKAVTDKYGRRPLVEVTERGDQLSTYGLRFLESDTKVNGAYKGPAAYTWNADSPVSTTRGGTQSYPVEQGSPQFNEVAAVGGQVDRSWQSMLENLRPDGSFDLRRSGASFIGAVAAATASRLLRRRG